MFTRQDMQHCSSLQPSTRYNVLRPTSQILKILGRWGTREFVYNNRNTQSLGRLRNLGPQSWVPLSRPDANCCICPNRSLHLHVEGFHILLLYSDQIHLKLKYAVNTPGHQKSDNHLNELGFNRPCLEPLLPNAHPNTNSYFPNSSRRSTGGLNVS